jgi:hypothetical protein
MTLSLAWRFRAPPGRRSALGNRDVAQRVVPPRSEALSAALEYALEREAAIAPQVRERIESSLHRLDLPLSGARNGAHRAHTRAFLRSAPGECVKPETRSRGEGDLNLRDPLFCARLLAFKCIFNAEHVTDRKTDQVRVISSSRWPLGSLK